MTPHDARPPAWLVAVCLVIGVVAAAAHAQDWVVRAVDMSSMPTYSSYINTDVMALPDGRVVVGYTPFSPAPGPVIQASIGAGDTFFDRTTLPQPGQAVSFDADDLGNIFSVAALAPYLYIQQDVSWTGTPDYQSGQISIGLTPSLTIDRHGIPSVAYVNPTNSTYMLARYDTAAGQWNTQSISTIGSYITRVPSLAFDSQNRPIVSTLDTTSVSAPGELAIRRLDPQAGWQTLWTGGAIPIRGTSIAANNAGDVAFAYMDAFNHFQVGIHHHNGVTTLEQVNAPINSILSPRSLTYDAAGNLALLLSGGTSGNSALLARRDAAGTWTYDSLPAAGFNGNLAFDADNNPYITLTNTASADDPYIYLLSKNLKALQRGDLNLSDTVEAADVSQFARAVRHPNDYLADHPGMSAADLMMLGDYTGDAQLTDADARAFADTINTAPVTGLPHRTDAYIAFDNADLDPSLGSGSGNFFNTTLATPKPYAPGDSRADLTGPTADAPDQLISAADIDYLYAQIISPSPDLRADLNDDGLADQLDVDILVLNILGTGYGDANLDGVVDTADRRLIQNTIAYNDDPENAGHLESGWAFGDINGDGVIDALDLAFTPAYVLGDFSLNGTLTNGDIQAMLDALTDLAGYKAGHNLTDADLLAIGDINHSGSVTNGDIQALLDLLTGSASAGNDPPTPLPEPASLALLACGTLALIRRR